MQQQSLFQAATSNFAGLPPAGWAAAGVAGLAIAGEDLLLWQRADLPLWAALSVLALPIIALWSGAYVGFAGLVRRPMTVAGATRFVLSGMILVAPILLGLAGLFLLPAGGFASILAVGAILLVVAAVAPMVLLQAWPAAQALSSRFVSPIRVLKATRGHRGGLIMTFLLASSLSRAKFLPDIDATMALRTVVAIGLAEMVVRAVSTAILASCIAATWTFAARNDPELL